MDKLQLIAGDIITVKNGDKYVLIPSVDNVNGDHVDALAFKTMKSTGLATDKFAVAGGNSTGGRDIVKVERFDACPDRNRVSEAMRYRDAYLTDITYCGNYDMFVVFDANALPAALEKLAQANALVAEAQAEIAALV